MSVEVVKKIMTENKTLPSVDRIETIKLWVNIINKLKTVPSGHPSENKTAKSQGRNRKSKQIITKYHNGIWNKRADLCRSETSQW